MPVGTTLAVLRQMLNAETGEEIDETISPARVSVNNQLLNNQQRFLAVNHGYLRGKTRAELAAVVGQQYYDIPATIDFDLLALPEFTNLANFRFRIGYGIGQDDYNLFRSDLGVTGSPIMKWDRVNVSGTYKIELWPIPSVAQTIMLEGLLPITAMAADSDTCVIDDLALVLYTAAQVLTGKESPLASLAVERAKVYFDALKAQQPIKYESINLAGKEPSLRDMWIGNKRRPVVATAVN